MEVLRTDSLVSLDPFASVIVSDPWLAKEPDVLDVNPGALDRIRALVDQHRLQEGIGGVTVAGDVGSGKTHLVKQILHTDAPFGFAYVYIDARCSGINAYTLQKVVCDLQRPRPGWGADQELSQFDSLLHGLLGPLSEGVEADGDPERFREVCNRLRRERFHSPLEREFLTALVQLWSVDKSGDALSFLSGDLPDELTASMLGIREANEDLSADEQEARAFDLLIALGKAFRGNAPLVIAFDQLENLSTSGMRARFFHFLSDLVSRSTAILPIIFARLDFVENIVIPELPDEHLRDRLFSHFIRLPGCNKAESLKLIRRRLEWAASQAGDGSQPPVSDEAIRRALAKLRGEINPPRKILRIARDFDWRVREAQANAGAVPVEMDDAVPSENPVEIIASAYAGELSQLSGARLPQWMPLELIIPLQDCFQANCPGIAPWKCQMVQAPRGGGDGTVVIQLGRAKASAVSLTVACLQDKDTGKLSKILHDLKAKAQGRGNKFAAFLRDERLPIPPKPGEMVRAAKAKELFLQAGGLYHEVTGEQILPFLALHSIRRMIEAEDLLYRIGSADTRPVTLEDFHVFLRERFANGLLSVLCGFLEQNAGKGSGPEKTAGDASRSAEPPLERGSGIPAVHATASMSESDLLETLFGILDTNPFHYTLEGILQSMELRLGSPQDSETVLKVIESAGDGIATFGDHPKTYTRRIKGAANG